MLIPFLIHYEIEKQQNETIFAFVWIFCLFAVQSSAWEAPVCPHKLRAAHAPLALFTCVLYLISTAFLLIKIFERAREDSVILNVCLAVSSHRLGKIFGHKTWFHINISIYLSYTQVQAQASKKRSEKNPLCYANGHFRSVIVWSNRSWLPFHNSFPIIEMINRRMNCFFRFLLESWDGCRLTLEDYLW